MLTVNDAAPAPDTVICGAVVNHPDGGTTGATVMVGPGGGGGVGTKPGPLFDAHDTLPAPSTTSTTTRICSLAMADGTVSDPTNAPALSPRSSDCQSPPAW